MAYNPENPNGQAVSASSAPVVLASDQTPIQDYRPSSGNITTQDAGSSVATGQNSGSIITGTPTANSNQSIVINGRSSARIQISGTWTGTLQFEISIDGGTTWYITSALVSGTSYRQSAITGNGLFFVDVCGCTNVRIRSTASMTGTATVQMTSPNVPGLVKINQPLSVIDNSNGNQLVINSSGQIAVSNSFALETGGNLATINTNTAPLLVSSAGGYIRQDSTATIAKESGGNLATLAGAVTSSVLQDNIKQINGVTPLMGAGNGGTGSLRINIASDQVSIPVAATLNAETTKAIGVVRNSDGAGNLLTSNSTTITSKFGLDSNILSILGTAPTTAGKLDIKGADGDVFVRNATASNFLANVTLQTQTDTTMVGGVNIKEINAVTPLMGNGTTGTGSLRVTIASDNTSNTNAWLIAGGKTNNNAAPGATNIGALIALANAATPTWTEGDQVLASVDLSGNQRTTLGTLIAGEDLVTNVMKVEQRVTYTNLSASTNAVKSGAGRFSGFIVNSHTSGTLKFWDSLTQATTTLLNTMTFAAGPSMWVFPVAINFATGLSVTIGGTIDFTVLWN